MLQELTKRVGQVKTWTKHKSIQHPWVGRFNVLKVSVFSKLFYEYYTSPTEIPLGDSKFLKNSQQNSGKDK